MSDQPLPPCPVHTKSSPPSTGKPTGTSTLVSVIETPSAEELSLPPSPTLRQSCNNPCSAFYTHPPTRHSLENLANDYKKNSETFVRIYDVEADAGRRSSVEPSKFESRVWPGREQICRGGERSKLGCVKNCTRRNAVMYRLRNPLAALTPMQKVAVKIVFALLFIGGVVGLGVGIAAAVGGGVWAGRNHQVDIGEV